jgi:hypothetical protein
MRLDRPHGFALQRRSTRRPCGAGMDAVPCLTRTNRTVVSCAGLTTRHGRGIAGARPARTSWRSSGPPDSTGIYPMVRLRRIASLQGRLEKDRSPRERRHSIARARNALHRPSEAFAVRWRRASAPTGRSAMTRLSVPTTCRSSILIRNASGLRLLSRYAKAPLQTV